MYLVFASSSGVFSLIDEAETIRKGPAAVVSQLHAFFHLHGLGEKQVTFNLTTVPAKIKIKP